MSDFDWFAERYEDALWAAREADGCCGNCGQPYEDTLPHRCAAVAS